LTERRLMGPEHWRADYIRISIAEMYEYSQVLEQIQLAHRLQLLFVSQNRSENLVSTTRGKFLNHVNE